MIALLAALVFLFALFTTAIGGVALIPLGLLLVALHLAVGDRFTLVR